jgi:hypothetical protein
MARPAGHRGRLEIPSASARNANNAPPPRSIAALFQNASEARRGAAFPSGGKSSRLAVERIGPIVAKIASWLSLNAG